MISISEQGKSKWRNFFQRPRVKDGMGRSTTREEREVQDPKRIFFPVWPCLWTVAIWVSVCDTGSKPWVRGMTWPGKGGQGVPLSSRPGGWEAGEGGIGNVLLEFSAQGLFSPG